MHLAQSSRGDVRLSGAGGRRIWPWIRAALLVVLGFLIVYPGGILVGLLLNYGPDETPLGLYGLLGLITNFTVGAVLWFFRKRPHARSIWTPAAVLLLVETVINLIRLTK
jgi:hypothetical protein